MKKRDMDTDVGLVYKVRAKYSPTEWDTTGTECPSGKLAYFPQETYKRKSQRGGCGGGGGGGEKERQTDRETETDRQTDRQTETERETKRDRDIEIERRDRETSRVEGKRD